jgi:hypothetical protein
MTHVTKCSAFVQLSLVKSKSSAYQDPPSLVAVFRPFISLPNPFGVFGFGFGDVV